MRRRGRAGRLLPAMAAIVAALAACLWLEGGWNLEMSVLSPDGRYQLDFYHGRRWQRAFYAVWYAEPGFARLTRRGADRALGTSRVIELDDTPVFWSADGVLVATQAEFSYARGRWVAPGSVRPHG